MSLIIQLPDRGLIVRREWLNRIYDNGKRIEMRTRNTKIRGRIAFIEAKSGLITGECVIEDSRELTQAELISLKHLHQVDDASLLKKWDHGWFIKDVIKYQQPIPYKTPPGAVIWVILT